MAQIHIWGGGGTFLGKPLKNRVVLCFGVLLKRGYPPTEDERATPKTGGLERVAGLLGLCGGQACAGELLKSTVGSFEGTSTNVNDHKTLTKGPGKLRSPSFQESQKWSFGMHGASHRHTGGEISPCQGKN